MQEGADEDVAGEAPFGDGEAIPNSSCLFCSTASSSVEENLKHMSTSHSFFVPDLEYLVDAEGTSLVKDLEALEEGNIGGEYILGPFGRNAFTKTFVFIASRIADVLGRKSWMRFSLPVVQRKRKSLPYR